MWDELRTHTHTHKIMDLSSHEPDSGAFPNKLISKNIVLRLALELGLGGWGLRTV